MNSVGGVIGLPITFTAAPAAQRCVVILLDLMSDVIADSPDLAALAFPLSRRFQNRTRFLDRRGSHSDASV